jgi:hypothetical protein
VLNNTQEMKMYKENPTTLEERMQNFRYVQPIICEDGSLYFGPNGPELLPVPRQRSPRKLKAARPHPVDRQLALYLEFSPPRLRRVK